MKKCQQCNTLYEDSVQYCLSDGTPLIQENFSLPTDDEEETVIHHDPIIVDLTPPPEPPRVTYQPVQAREPSRSWSPLLFLLLGLIIGGGLVLATVFVSRSLFREESALNNSPATESNRQSPRPTLAPATPTPSPTTSNYTETTDKHLEPNPDADESALNGRVISLNAYVRSAPNGEASIVDTLPVDDRVRIGRRQAPSSPWFEVVCEHGTSGWMHGNTIEFDR